MAAIFQDCRHLNGAVKQYNCLVSDTSMQIGMSSLYDKKTPPATWNFNFQDGRPLEPQKINFLIEMYVFFIKDDLVSFYFRLF